MAALGRFLEVLETDVVAAAPLLLGAELTRGDLRARIVEVESYRGSDDPAAHSFGKTKMKNMALFGPPGRAYIYFSYGFHWMLNVSALPMGQGAGILIRAAEPLAGFETFRERRPKAKKDEDLLSGPGKLAAAFGIDMRDNDTYLLEESPGEGALSIRLSEETIRVVTGPRVGIAIGKAHELPWRFMDADRMRWVSKPWPRA